MSQSIPSESEWEGFRSQPGFREHGIGEPTLCNSSHLEDDPPHLPPALPRTREARREGHRGGDSSAGGAATVSPSSGLQSTSVDEKGEWFPPQRSTFDVSAQVPFLQHPNASCVVGQGSHRALASVDGLAQDRARNLGKRRGECPEEPAMDARLLMMQDSLNKAVSKAQAKAQKTHDGHDAPTSPAGAPSSRGQQVADIRTMLDADPAIRLCKEGMTERARRNKEKMIQKATHRQLSRSFQGDVGDGAGLDPDGRRAPSLFGSSEPHKVSRSVQSFDEEFIMYRRPRNGRSSDSKGGGAKQFPCSSFEKVQAARSRMEQRSNSRDSLNCDRARPMSPTTEFLLSTTFDHILTMGANTSKANSAADPLKGSDGLPSRKGPKDSFSSEGF